MARSRIALDGLPHSEISGSKPVCGSPKLIAAYHVLHRRPAPRHPPYALSSLTTTFTLLETCSRLLDALQNSESSVVNEPRARWPAGSAPFETTPIGFPRFLRTVDRWRLGNPRVVELAGLEPATSALQRRSSPS